MSLHELDELRASSAHVFVDDLETPVLTMADARHLGAVRRMRPDEVVTVSDGQGRWRTCRWKPGGALEVGGQIVETAVPSPAIAVGFALTKGSKADLVVQKLTELGVERIVPVLAERSVLRWGEDQMRGHAARWAAIAREAAMQSRQVRLPVIDRPRDFARAVSECGAWRQAGRPARVVLAEPGGGPFRLDGPTVIMVGPEGGWDGTELALVSARVALPGGVLRAETAAVAAGVLLSGLREGVIAAARPR